MPTLILIQAWCPLQTLSAVIYLADQPNTRYAHHASRAKVSHGLQSIPPWWSGIDEHGTEAMRQTKRGEGSAAKPSSTCVCLVRHGYYPDDVRDRKEARALAEAGYDVDVVCLKRPDQSTREDVDGVSVYRVSMAHRRSTLLHYIALYVASFVRLGLRLLTLHLRRRYACISVATMPDFLVFSTLIPKILGAKVLLDLREPMPEIWLTKYGNRHKLIHKLQELIEQLALAYADATITVTQELRNRVIERGARGEKISVVKNVCDENWLLKPRGGLPEERASGLRLVMHGIIEERYGHEDAIRAVSELKDEMPGLHLDIVGSGEFRPVLEKLVTELQCSDCVEFAGFVSREELFRFVNSADAALIAMRRSPYSELIDTNKMYEYMALRKPLITPRLTPIARQLDDSCVAFFEPGDHQDLARCIANLFHDPELARQRADRAYERYRELKWEHSKRIYLDVVERLAA